MQSLCCCNIEGEDRKTSFRLHKPWDAVASQWKHPDAARNCARQDKEKAETAEALAAMDETFNGKLKIFCLRTPKEKNDFLDVLCKTGKV